MESLPDGGALSKERCYVQIPRLQFFFLPSSHPFRLELKHKDLNLPLAEDPYQNNDVTCEMPVTDLVRGRCPGPSHASTGCNGH